MRGYYCICTPKNLTVVFLSRLPFSCQCYFPPANVTAKTLSLFMSCNFSQFDIIKFSIMSSYASQSLSNLIRCLLMKIHMKKKNLDCILSIWDDDHIHRVDETNWRCLWFNKISQGINSTKYLAQVLGKKGMHIKICFAYMEKSHITVYQELHNFKAAQKGVIR